MQSPGCLKKRKTSTGFFLPQSSRPGSNLGWAACNCCAPTAQPCPPPNPNSREGNLRVQGKLRAEEARRSRRGRLASPAQRQHRGGSLAKRTSRLFETSAKPPPPPSSRPSPASSNSRPASRCDPSAAAPLACPPQLSRGLLPLCASVAKAGADRFRRPSRALPSSSSSLFLRRSPQAAAAAHCAALLPGSSAELAPLQTEAASSGRRTTTSPPLSSRRLRLAGPAWITSKPLLAGHPPLPPEPRGMAGGEGDGSPEDRKETTVTPDVRHESLSCKTFPYLLIKMINKSRWKILGVLAVFLLMVWYTISREESFDFHFQDEKMTCPFKEVEKKAAQLIPNYTREPPLFLHLKDYFWVKTPSLYELPYGTKGTEDVLLRLLAITSYSLPENFQRLKCRRCAVVGNGYRLRNSSIGEVINKYDIVIRLNNAPVHGYERDVGTKTTMRLFYPESAHFNPQTDNNPNTLLVLVAFKPMDFMWMETILHDKKRIRKGFWKQPPLIWNANPKQVRILNPYFMEVAAAKVLKLPMKHLWKLREKPTTGLVAITLALHFCDVVDIAGFGYPSSDDKKQSIHYYEHITVKSMASSGHNVSHEALAIKQMLELGLVKNLTYF